jgi:hypothetical protein
MSREQRDNFACASFKIAESSQVANTCEPVGTGEPYVGHFACWAEGLVHEAHASPAFIG